MTSWRECKWTGIENVEIVVKAESYQDDGYKHIRYIGNLKAVLIEICNIHSYYDQAEEMFDDGASIVDVLANIEEINGDGCDYIHKMDIFINSEVYTVIDEMFEEEIVHVA